VRFQSFGARQRRNGRRQPSKRFRRQLLHRNDLQKICDREPSALARYSAGRQNVIRSRCVIAGGLRTERPDKHAAGVPHLLQQFLVRNIQVFGRYPVCYLHGFI